MTLPLEREAIMPRIEGMRKNLERLRALGALPYEQFAQGDPFDLAQHHLRLALEGVFHIGAHILSRMPDGRTVEYQEIAKKLGEKGIVSQAFADRALVPMARMRNLLVHHYANIDGQRLYNVVNTHLSDIETFLQSVREVVENPGKLGLKIE